MKIPVLIVISYLWHTNSWCCQPPSKPMPDLNPDTAIPPLIDGTLASNSGYYTDDELDKRRTFISRLRAKLPQDLPNLDQLQPRNTAQSASISDRSPEK